MLGMSRIIAVKKSLCGTLWECMNIFKFHLILNTIFTKKTKGKDSNRRFNCTYFRCLILLINNTFIINALKVKFVTIV